MATDPPSEGSKALSAYLARRGMSLYAFCKEHDLDYSQVYRARQGDRRSVYGPLALAIETATDGEVPMRAWYPAGAQ